MRSAVIPGLAPYQPGPISYKVRLAHPRYHTAALLCRAFTVTADDTAEQARAIGALQETTAATIGHGAAFLKPHVRAHCEAAAKHARALASRVPAGERVAVLACVVRSLLDEAPDAYCALDRRVRDVCERRYPSTAVQRDVAALIVEAVDAQVRR